MTDTASMKKYTLVQPVVMEGFPDAHNVFLQVTNQRFCVSPHGCDTKEDAEWMQDQLCVALAKLVDDELVGYRTPATPPDFANILDAAATTPSAVRLYRILGGLYSVAALTFSWWHRTQPRRSKLRNI